MTPFMKGALGFLGCAAVAGVAYAIGKRVGREEALREVETEEKKIAAQNIQEPAVQSTETKETTDTDHPAESEEKSETAIVPQKANVVENVRKKHGIRNRIFGGIGMVKDLFGNMDDKLLTVTTDGGDIVARLSQKPSG